MSKWNGIEIITSESILDDVIFIMNKSRMDELSKGLNTDSHLSDAFRYMCMAKNVDPEYRRWSWSWIKYKVRKLYRALIAKLKAEVGE